MKSYIYIAAIAASISLFPSCSENEIEDAPVSNVRVEKTFGVSTPSSSSTRAYIYDFDRNPYKPAQSVLWHDDDQITIFAKGHEEGDRFSLVSFGSEGYNHGNFSGKTYQGNEYYVLYPYQPSARLTDDGHIKCTIPVDQQATKGSFDRAAAIYTGYVESATGEIGLSTAVSFLSFHANASVNTVQMRTSDPEWNLAGTVTVLPKSGGSLIQGFVQGSSTVTLHNITEEGDYLLAFIPSNKLPAFSVAVWAGEGVYEFQFSSKNQFLAGNIYELGTLGTNGTPVTPPSQE